LAAAFAVRVTFVPRVKVAEQVPVVPVVQLIPAGLLVTVPEPTMTAETVATVLLKVAVTDWLDVRVITHGAVPEHPPPLQPKKAKSVPGVAVSVTLVPVLKFAEHVPGQLIPAGLLVTVPVPTTVTETVATVGVNVAVTDVSDVRVITHVPVPEHPPPLQPVKVKSVPGVAVSVTLVLSGKGAAHVPGQLMPAGLLVTVPVPTTVTERLAATWLKVAVTASSDVRVITHWPVPVHAPLHPVKVKFVPGVAVSVTFVLGGKGAVHVPGQLMPAGLLVTVPVPAMVTETVGKGVKVAVTNSLRFVRLITHVPVPEHPPPLQPVKVEFVPATAVSVTCVGFGKLAEHVPTPGQVIPVGLLVTVPVPVPARVTRIPEVFTVYRSTNASGQTTLMNFPVCRFRT
jgi:phage tail protein X